MMDMLQKFLSENTLRDLEVEHGVIARRSDCGTKFSLNYDQFMSKPGDPIAELCRGVVLRPATDLGACLLASDDWWESILGECFYLARTMKRFYNHGEHVAAPVNFADPKLHVMDKLDGTMTACYWDELNDKWCVATRSVPDANIPFGASELLSGVENMTFSDLFWVAYENVVGTPREQVPMYFEEGYTYIFELTSQINKNVVQYDKPSLTLIALIKNDSGLEEDVYASEHAKCFPRPNVWSLSSFSEVVEYVNSQDPSKCEGAVICDSSFNRVKVKSAAYVLAHKAKDIIDTSPVAALLSVLDGTVDDVLPLLDVATRGRFEKIRSDVAAYLCHLDSVYAKLAHDSSSQKDFAIRVNASGEWSGPLFNLHKMNAQSGDSRYSISDWVQEQLKSGRFTSTMCKELLKRISKHA